MIGAETWAVGRLLGATTEFLAGKGSPTPRLDAELLLARVLALTKVQLYINFDREVRPGELDQYRELVRRRARREPVAYILGEKEFYGLGLKTTPAALVPRPETELLVDEALRLAKKNWPDEDILAADIGCGGGAIALALARELPRAEILAVDISPEALALARTNALNLGLDNRLTFLPGDLAAPLAGRLFQLICANLPYIPESELAGLMPEVGAYEPRLALDGGPEGLAVIRRLLPDAPGLLAADGRLLLEIWPDSLAALTDSAGRANLAVEEVLRDLGGHQRIVVLRNR
ncbi:MAG: peptide chain release factor N(5)-glutamine methyltransferase [Deltaproteobacteria bacterium]|nr:peptide chain release factor N(5)-glutamine methyltransferase [Deltaproteobacteria bacterium]